MRRPSGRRISWRAVDTASVSVPEALFREVRAFAKKREWAHLREFAPVRGSNCLLPA